METFKFWLENDRELPRFKRLNFVTVPVSLASVLGRGIHPWQPQEYRSSLNEKFAALLNSEDFKPAELNRFEYCRDIHCGGWVTRSAPSPFEALVELIRNGIYFVDELPYSEVVEIAVKRIEDTWSHHVAKNILLQTHSRFEDLRAFLKQKDEHIKLNGYVDLESYDLARVLSPSDFLSEDRVIVDEALPVTNFRLARFLESVTDESGLLRLAETIRDFQVKVPTEESQGSKIITYNCVAEREAVRFLPELTCDPGRRSAAAGIARRWRTDSGRYCFTTNVSRVAELVDERGVEIKFPSLDYINPEKDCETSSGKVSESGITRFTIGDYPTRLDSADRIRSLLRMHGVSAQGRKQELLEKLASLAVRLYKERARELDDYFTVHRFVRIAGEDPSKTKPLPLLKELDLGSLVLAMYVLKHLRGNVILEAGHEDDSFDLLSLARSLLNKETALEGSFARA